MEYLDRLVHNKKSKDQTDNGEMDLMPEDLDYLEL